MKKTINRESEVESARGARLSRAAANWEVESVWNFCTVPAISARCGSGDPRSGGKAGSAFGIILAAILALALAGTGCRSMSGPASASFASVTITGRSMEQIRDTTTTVFRADGYEASASGPALVFEKEGTRANTMAHDGLIAAQGGASTIVRVRVELVDLGGDTPRLQCQAFMVKSAGDSFFEEEHRIANFRSRPYQNLLDEVAKKLKQP